MLANTNVSKKKKRRSMFRRKRTLDLATVIDYKEADMLRRFITDRGKIIPRRVSGATAAQQRAICLEVKRARYLALLPFSIAHRQEKKMIVDVAMAASATGMGFRPDRRPNPSHDDLGGEGRGSADE